MLAPAPTWEVLDRGFASQQAAAALPFLARLLFGGKTGFGGGWPRPCASAEGVLPPVHLGAGAPPLLVELSSRRLPPPLFSPILRCALSPRHLISSIFARMLRDCRTDFVSACVLVQSDVIPVTLTCIPPLKTHARCTRGGGMREKGKKFTGFGCCWGCPRVARQCGGALMALWV